MLHAMSAVLQRLASHLPHQSQAENVCFKPSSNLIPPVLMSTTVFHSQNVASRAYLQQPVSILTERSWYLKITHRGDDCLTWTSSPFSICLREMNLFIAKPQPRTLTRNSCPKLKKLNTRADSSPRSHYFEESFCSSLSCSLSSYSKSRVTKGQLFTWNDAALYAACSPNPQ